MSLQCLRLNGKTSGYKELEVTFLDVSIARKHRTNVDLCIHGMGHGFQVEADLGRYYRTLKSTDPVIGRSVRVAVRLDILT